MIYVQLLHVVCFQARLCEDVSVVFHSAATVRFNESLKSAVAINMLGTRSVIQLCQRMQSLSVRIDVKLMKVLNFCYISL